MLPQNNNTSRKIYVNPNFKGQQQHERYIDVETGLSQPHMPVNAHINPLFLEKQQINRTKIYMNPMFLLKLREQQQKMSVPDAEHIKPVVSTNLVSAEEARGSGASEQMVCKTNATSRTAFPAEERKIICKSKNRLIREPIMRPTTQRSLSQKHSEMQPQPLVVVSKRKLIRKPMVSPLKCLNGVKQTNTASAWTKTAKTKYKLDNRIVRKKVLPVSPFSIKIKRKSFVGPYALRRTSTSLNQNLWKQGLVKAANAQSMNRKLELLNINGLLYKSTRNKLQLKGASNKLPNVISKSKKATITQTNKTSPGLTIFVRGTKYVMDSHKFKLTRVINTEKDTTSANICKSPPSHSRIHIGGFTYVAAPSARNVFIRTTNHLARAYVHSAKQKSLHVLTKHLHKSNIPCPIYQRLGKCAAFERGKCSKVHNKLQVAICTKFLRGECLNSKCLLSHDVSLSKMPVCKFFLQGVCVRNDCPYLHKKLSNKAEVCIDFLRGFCKLADKCNKRHEFVCPDLERNGLCKSKTCVYCKIRLKKKKLAETKQTRTQHNASAHKEDTANTAPTSATTENIETSTGMRYFISPSGDEMKIDSDNVVTESTKQDSSDTELEEQLSPTAAEDIVRKRPKLGILPAFIPL